MKRIAALLVASALASACSRPAHESATAQKLGFPESQQADVGPYTVHYGRSSDSELVLLARGNHNVVSVVGDQTSVYWQGRPFLEVKSGPDGRPTSFMLYVTDATGNDLVSLIDRDVDGQWDLKIDHRAKMLFEFQNGKWHERPDGVGPMGDWKKKSESEEGASNKAVDPTPGTAPRNSGESSEG